MKNIQEVVTPIFEAAKHIANLEDLEALASSCETPLSNTCLQAATLAHGPACFDLQIRWATTPVCQ